MQHAFKLKRNCGFSMIELIVVIVIIGILSVITLPMLQTGFNSYFIQRNLSNVNWQGRLALSRMTRDIRNIPATGNITTAGVTQLTFTNNNNEIISYTLNGTNLQRNGLTLANGVNSILFKYSDSAGVSTGTIANIRYITVTLNITQNNTNITLRTVFNLRDVIS
ncbi:MAG: hypothetical protein A3F12_02070 [Gammaproteobacteria bacterium RIFCSPHIGHO2_12_FULL_38_14]|nr:MAG: hypothetical protein A3F12_02070 [Gammaproteobacteria bacterium RIFCSPHIGHO2_12_FULL_38_14]